jgi:hypothetical protein
VRELENFVEGLIVTATEPTITEEQAKPALGPSVFEHPIDLARSDLVPLRELEQLYIRLGARAHRWEPHARGRHPRRRSIDPLPPGREGARLAAP